MTPIAVKRIKKETVNPDHGGFECYYDKEGKQDVLVERLLNANGEQVYKRKYYPSKGGQNYCSFLPKRGAMFYTVNAVGGGSPGSGVTSVFKGLPQGYGGEGDSDKAGVNYINEFTKFKSLIVDIGDSIGKGPDADTTIDFSNVIGSTTTDSPRKWLNDMGVYLRAVLLSRGGTIITDRKDPGAAYVTKIKNTSAGPECASYSPNFGSHTWNSPEWVNKCFTSHLYFGENPQKGSALRTKILTLKQGSSLKAHANYAGGGPQFSAGSVGCQLTKGSDGCYPHLYPCPRKEGEALGYDGKNCNYSAYDSSDNNVFKKGQGYNMEARTITSLGDTAVIQVGVQYSGECDAEQKSSTGACNPPLYVKDDTLSKPSENSLLYLFGRFVLAWQRLSKGVNFYAQSGNPGEYRTLYVSKFKSSLTIIPGPPRDAKLDGDNSVPGYPTVVCYDGKDKTHKCNYDGGAIKLLKVAGGKQAVSNDVDTFIIGNLFNLPPGAGHIVAYDTKNGVQYSSGESEDLDESDDMSAKRNEYGEYFMAKSSNFVYPIPKLDSTEKPFPSDVGQGGHGAYTIFRKPGITDSYSMYWSDFASKSAKNKNNSGSVGGIIGASYTCRSSDFSVSGKNANAHRCYPGRGKGGAVVITW